MKKKILILTGSRSEYGILEPLIFKLKKCKLFKVEIAAFSAHLSKTYGNTINEINFNKKILHKIRTHKNIKLSKITDIHSSIIEGFIKFNKFYKKREFDLVVVLGDRYEILPPVILSFFLRIPIAHIHGGEKTTGSTDDIVRHVITKFSDYHFVSTEEYRNRVIQLGENPKNIFKIGSLSCEKIKSLNFLNRKKIEKKLNIEFGKKNYLITFHTEINFLNEKIFLNKLFKNLLKEENTKLFVTYPNSDPGSHRIIEIIEKFSKKHKNNFYAFKSLGSEIYFSLMKKMDIVIGNSSSGIIETPYLKVPTINVGKRQDGRIVSKNIINCNYECSEINSCIKKIRSEKFQKILKTTIPRYGYIKSSQKILHVLKKINVSKNQKLKEFYDIKK
jgi:GDP/UDP-N,N'-diacetylbacillosamine 2-epimerase (hydrolysing)